MYGEKYIILRGGTRVNGNYPPPSTKLPKLFILRRDLVIAETKPGSPGNSDLATVQEGRRGGEGRGGGSREGRN